MEDHQMQQQPSGEPPSYAQVHDPETLQFPSVPDAGTATIFNGQSQHVDSVSRDSPFRFAGPVEPPLEVSPWPSSNPLTIYYSPGSRSTQELSSPNPMDVDIVADGHNWRGGSVLSIDDPDVRLAAEALGDLRAADFVQSPSQQHDLPPHSPANVQNGHAGGKQPEPLLSLLTTSHPLLGTAIGGSLSAYSASKNYSPRFKSSVEYVERGLTPVVNTVGSVGRVTGVEGGVRWFLGGRNPNHNRQSDLESGGRGFNKRRKVDIDVDMDVDNSHSQDSYHVHRQFFPQDYKQKTSRESTVESLPAYDEHRSPNYEVDSEQALIARDQNRSSSPSSTWQSRLVLSTSGLSIAMSEESLRSLKYCLNWLKWANTHIGNVINALQEALYRYEASWESRSNQETKNGDIEIGQHDDEQVRSDQPNPNALSALIAELKSDILKTLKDVVDVVSKYAGGALPENARVLVRRHLTSLPQRFRLASKAPVDVHGADGRGGNGVRDGAKKVILLAREGLDMMAQVSGVLDGTIVSAEEWCERLGKKKRDEPGLEKALDTLPATVDIAVPITAVETGLAPSPDVKLG